MTNNVERFLNNRHYKPFSIFLRDEECRSFMTIGYYGRFESFSDRRDVCVRF